MLITKILLGISVVSFISALVIFRKDTRTRLCILSSGTILNVERRLFDTTKYVIQVCNPRGTFVVSTYAIYTVREYKVGEKVQVILDTLENNEKIVYLVDVHGKPIYTTLMAKLTKLLVAISAISLILISVIMLLKTIIEVLF